MKEFTIKCADCKFKKVFSARTIRQIYDKARDEGWAIDRNNENKWCPNCAELHRHVGRRGAKPAVQTSIFGASGEKVFKG